MDTAGWLITLTVFGLLYYLFAWFRVGANWGAAVGTVMFLVMYAVYPKFLDSLPVIVNALWKP